MAVQLTKHIRLTGSRLDGVSRQRAASWPESVRFAAELGRQVATCFGTETGMSDLRWVHSEGGPLLLLPVALLRDWGGVAAPPPGREIVARFRWDADGPATDYDRACDVSDYVGVIPIGAGEGLVLGDEPSATTWLPRVDGGLLARWVYALGDEQAAAALGRVPSTLPWEMAGEFEVDSSPLELFDSGEPGPDVHGERLRVELVPGSYAISHAAYEPDPDTAFRIIRLRRNIRHE